MRRVRESPAPCAVILLTAKGDESDRVIGLRLGADDYVVKPFSPAELVARVDAVLRRVNTVAEHAPALTFGDLEIDPTSRRVTHAGEDMALTAREFDLLHFLARHPGRAFTREELMDHVWQYSFLHGYVHGDGAHPAVAGEVGGRPGVRRGGSRRYGASGTASRAERSRSHWRWP